MYRYVTIKCLYIPNTHKYLQYLKYFMYNKSIGQKKILRLFVYRNYIIALFVQNNLIQR